jgi:hypothetical protein
MRWLDGDILMNAAQLHHCYSERHLIDRYIILLVIRSISTYNRDFNYLKVQCILLSIVVDTQEKNYPIRYV